MRKNAILKNLEWFNLRGDNSWGGMLKNEMRKRIGKAMVFDQLKTNDVMLSLTMHELKTSGLMLNQLNNEKQFALLFLR